MKRRTFVKTLPAATLLAGTASAYSLGTSGLQELQPIILPEPEKEGGKSLLVSI